MAYASKGPYYCGMRGVQLPFGSLFHIQKSIMESIFPRRGVEEIFFALKSPENSQKRGVWSANAINICKKRAQNWLFAKK